MGQGGFADAGDNLDQQVSAGKQGDERQLDDLIFTADNRLNGFLEASQLAGAIRHRRFTLGFFHSRRLASPSSRDAESLEICRPEEPEATRHLRIGLLLQMRGCFPKSTLSEMKKILRLRLRMTANGLSMTVSLSSATCSTLSASR